MQTGFHRANRAIEDGGHLRQGSIIKEPQPDDDPMLLGERFNAAPQLSGDFVLACGVRRGRFWRGNILMLLIQFAGLKEREPSQGTRARARTADGFLIAMQQDGIEPCGEAAGPVIASKTRPGRHEGF